MSETKKENSAVDAQNTKQTEDDEMDDWDKRIYSTGCAAEQTKLIDCQFGKKDWRSCVKELQEFRDCWKNKGNDSRTATKDA